MVDGVRGVKSGYAGGHTPSPTYEQVCTGTTGHAEVVQVTFDPGVISYGEILEIFFATHDPTTLNRQGNDVGTQYRSERRGRGTTPSSRRSFRSTPSIGPRRITTSITGATRRSRTVML
jgi:methionine-S-sulfoxide reductase